MTKFSAHGHSLSWIFGIESSSSVIYAIPSYQREYTWGKNEWEGLFDDIQENDKGYFLGSIICVDQTDDRLGVNKLEVIDGQQRLITISLLFAAIYRLLEAHKKDLDEDQQTEKNNLKRKLVLKGKNDQFRIIPQTQNNNQEDYHAVLSYVGVTDIPFHEPLKAGNRKIFRALRYFELRINEMVAEKETRDKLDSIVFFLEKVNESCLVMIEVGNHADAYTLFESLNNRGIPLTAIDLIKNKLLAKLEKVEPDSVNSYFQIWSDLLKDIGDEPAVQERFFRHYYNAFKESLNAPFHSVDSKKKDPLGAIATKSNLIKIYEKLINQNAKKHLDNIRDAGRLYSLMLEDRMQQSRFTDEKWVPLKKPLLDLYRIEGTPSHLLMLYLLVKKNDLDINTGNLCEIINMLVSFFVRRNLTDTPPTRDLTRLFIGIISQISSLSGDQVVGEIRKGLLDKSSSDQFFLDKLEGDIYKENSAIARFVLCALEEQSMTREKYRDLWDRKGKKASFVWTIEHIFPQGNKIRKEWVDMIANGDKEEAEKIQQSHVHKLGNLTLSGFNGPLGNKSFADKRDLTDKDDRPVGYNNGLELNKELAKAETWNAEKIDKRTACLADQALKLFRLD